MNTQASPRNGSLPWTILDVSLPYKPRDLVSHLGNWIDTVAQTFLRVNQITYIEGDKMLQAVWRLLARAILKSSLPPPRKISKLLKSIQNAQWNSSFQFLLPNNKTSNTLTHPHRLYSFLSKATAITLSECSLCFLLWNRTTQLLQFVSCQIALSTTNVFPPLSRQLLLIFQFSS